MGHQQIGLPSGPGFFHDNNQLFIAWIHGKPGDVIVSGDGNGGDFFPLNAFIYLS